MYMLSPCACELVDIEDPRVMAVPVIVLLPLWQDANSCDNEIRDLRDNQQEISHVLEEKQRNVQQLQSSADTCDGDIERLMEQKQRVRLSQLQIW